MISFPAKPRGRTFRSNAALLCAVLTSSILTGASVALLQGTARFILPGLVLAAGAVLLSLRDTLLPLVLLALMLPFDELLVIGSPGQAPSLPTLLIVPGALMLFSILVSACLHHEPLRVNKKAAPLAILLGLLATFSAALDGGAPAVLVHARRYWLVIALFLMVPNCLAERRDFTRLAWALTLSLGLSGGFALLSRAQAFLQLAGQADLNINQFHNLPLAIGDKNIVGMQLSAGIPFGLFLAFSEASRKRRALAMAAASLMTLGLGAMVSVGATAGFAAIVLLLLLFARSNRQRARLLIFTIPAVGGLLLSPVRERIAAQVESLKTEAPQEWGSERGMNWTTGYLAMRDSPWTGQGPGVESLTEFGARTLPFRSLTARLSDGRGYTPHNLFLAVGAELGAPALLVFAGLLLAALLPLGTQARPRAADPEGRRSPAWTLPQAVLTAAAGVLVQGMGLSVQVDKYLWLLLGMAAAWPGQPERAGPETGRAGLKTGRTESGPA